MKTIRRRKRRRDFWCPSVPIVESAGHHQHVGFTRGLFLSSSDRRLRLSGPTHGRPVVVPRRGCTTLMSMSPTVSSFSETPLKRRRTSGADMSQNNQGEGSGQGGHQTHVPKRGARACTACRKGKNRCEGEVRIHQTSRLFRSLLTGPAHPPGPVEQAPCRRCQFSGTPCIFEKPEKKNVPMMSGASVE